jgi:two-component system, NtrC family, response regulator HydG
LAHGSMREDFYYRIKVYEITLPPLRERLADVAPLLSWFAQKHSAANGAAHATFSEAAMRRLLEHAWPGNVRELRNVVEHAMVTAEGDCVELCDLPEDVRRPGGVARGSLRVAETEQGLAAGWSPRELEERLQVLAELDRNDWNRTETAVALGYSRVTLWKKMRKFGIDEGVFRRGG